MRRRSKFANRSTEYNGIVYHSKKEATYAVELDFRVKAKDIKSWDRQVKVELKIKGKLITRYFLDFLIQHNDGTIEYVEVKGFETDVWKLKWKMFEALYGGNRKVKLTIVR